MCVEAARLLFCRSLDLGSNVCSFLLLVPLFLPPSSYYPLIACRLCADGTGIGLSRLLQALSVHNLQLHTDSSLARLDGVVGQEPMASGVELMSHSHDAAIEHVTVPVVEPPDASDWSWELDVLPLLSGAG